MLLLDIGNSAIKGQWWDDGELRQSFSCRFQLGWQARFVGCLAGIRAKRCYFSSVQDGQIESEISQLLEEFNETLSFNRLNAAKTCGAVKNAYKKPASLGVDRWLCLLAASALVQQDAIIIDFGSAISIDLLRADGQHLGGAILPGFNTSIKQFKRIMRTADFDRPEISHTDEPGCFTEACINIDCETTDASVVGRLVDRWFQELAPDAVLIVTGGGANRMHKHFSRVHRLIPDLVFQGMQRHLENDESIF